MALEWTVLWLVFCLQHLSGQALVPVKSTSYEFCKTTHVTLGGIGSRGNLTSEGYPQWIGSQFWNQPMCQLTLTACEECRISVEVVEISLPTCYQVPHMGSCIYGCDSIMMFESAMPERTTHYFKSGDKGQVFMANTSKIFIKYCHADANNGRNRRFLLTYTVYEKKTSILGYNGENGTFTSPWFPNGFKSSLWTHLSKEIFYYHLHNINTYGTIRLWFDDWSLPRSSYLRIYDGASKSRPILAQLRGSDKRPFVQSHYSDLLIELYTGDGSDFYMPHLGFQAHYEFTQYAHWTNKPLFDCGEYLHSLKGGIFGFNHTQKSCVRSGYMDCIWVIWKYNFPETSEQLMIHLKSLAFFEGDHFEIREGNNSRGELLATHADKMITMTFVTPGDAFYIRLRARCSYDRHLEGVFATFVDTLSRDKNSCPNTGMFACLNNRCIAKSLTCDGVDHCVDGFSYDEMYCRQVTTPEASSCTSFLRCHGDNAWYCKEKHCDGHRDCEDWTDEKNCWINSTPATSVDSSPDIFSAYHWGTIIPIVLICIVLAVIACIIVSYYTRRKQRARQRRRAHGQSNTISGTCPGPVMRYPEAPPTYEESMTSPHDIGIYNMAYSRSDSSEQLGQPPPYTPVQEGPLRYQPASYPPQPGRPMPLMVGNQPVTSSTQPASNLTSQPAVGLSGGRCVPGVHSYSGNTGMLNQIGQVQQILNGRQGVIAGGSQVAPNRNVDQSRATAPAITEPQARPTNPNPDQEDRLISGQGALGEQILPMMGTNIEMREISNEHLTPTRNFPTNSMACSTGNVDSSESSTKQTQGAVPTKPATMDAKENSVEDSLSLQDKDSADSPQNKPGDTLTFQVDGLSHDGPQGNNQIPLSEGGDGLQTNTGITLENSSASFV